MKAIIEANCPSVTKYQQLFVSYGMQDAMGKISDARNALMNLPEQWRKPVASDSKTSLEFWDKGKKSKSQLISLPNRTVRGFGTSNPYGGISLDEFAFHREDCQIYESVLPTLIRGGLLAIGSTPLAKSGTFYEILSNIDKYPVFKRVTIPWWWSSPMCTDVKTAITEAPGMTTWERVERFGTETLKLIFNSNGLKSFKQEFECEFTDESEAFISLEMIMSCTPQEPEQYEYQNISEFINGIDLDGVCTGMDKEGNPIFESVRAPAYDPEIHGTLYAGMDMGRTKDSSIFTLLGLKDGKRYEWMCYELKNTSFDEQREFVRMAMGSLPIRRLLIDSTGLGMEFGEWAEKQFPTRATGVHFTNETKEDMANKVYLACERKQYSFPMNRKLHADIHCIRKTMTATKHSRYDGSTKDSHADRFWSLALAELGINDTITDKSRFYSQYTKTKSTTEKIKKASTGNPELDRMLNRMRRRNARERR
ncbi:MAG: hypothetical protein PQJ59_16920 [Spirochaetales bacterium]|nr:hypothetical protein [Spirochaetales bacterium]